MIDRRLLDRAIAGLGNNPEQREAVFEKGHCIVLAGPGSGKTKTLTIAMARALIEDIQEPRGIACITYNNECALELENRLASLGIEPSERVFIGTVHSFAVSQVIVPYARCVLSDLRAGFQVATPQQCTQSIETAYYSTIGGNERPRERWRYAELKRRSDVDRTLSNWQGRNPELRGFIEAYETDLRRQNLIDFDDMPLLAFRMVQAHQWIQRSLWAKFPILFVDEYQDLGHALHELVLKLCFEAGIRLFAVGDADQSIYAFTGANPDLLRSIAERQDVRTIHLRVNYRSGTKLIDASMAALGEEREYVPVDGAAAGQIFFHGVAGDFNAQADHVINTIVADLQRRGIPLHEIAVLYRTAAQGHPVAVAALAADIPFVRADSASLVRRSSRLSRWIEASAAWVMGGWKDASPSFRRLAREATTLVFGASASLKERETIEYELITFLSTSIEKVHSANSWLKSLRDDVLRSWIVRARTIGEDWHAAEEMISRTEGTGDISLSHFSGRIEGSGRLNLSTLHSAKGREFDAVVLFAMDNEIIPTNQERRRTNDLREVRRLFYVGVTRARKELYFVFTEGQNSEWVYDLYDRIREN